MSNSFKRELFAFGGSSLLIVLSFLVLFRVHEIEMTLIDKLETSVPQRCEKAIVKGARGEVYKGYLVTLIDKKGFTWQLKVKTDDHLAVFCEEKKERG